MSKSSSVLSKGAGAALLIFLAALSGCQREGEADQGAKVRSSTVVEPEMANIDSVAEEEPAVARAQWRAVSEAARSVTGNLRVSLQGPRGGPVVFAFANGVTITAQPINVVPAEQRSGVGGQSFAAVLGGDPRVFAHIYRVVTDNVTRSAAQGGLCGAEPTRHLAVSEFVDSNGNWVFKLAAFRGERPPGAPGQDPVLCSAYAFAAS